MGWFRETPESLRMLDEERAKLAADEAKYCQLTLDAADHTHYCDDWADHSAGAHHCGECGLLWNPTSRLLLEETQRQLSDCIRDFCALRDALPRDRVQQILDPAVDECF